MKKAFHIAAHRPPGPGAGRHPEGRHAGTSAEFDYPKTVEMRSYNPVTKGHAGPDQEGGAAAARRPKRPMIYTGGGVDPRQRVAPS